VVLGQEVLHQNDYISAIRIKSGNANSCTGSKGSEDSEATVATLAKALRIEPTSVMVSSTDIIGVCFNMVTLLADTESSILALSSDEEAVQNCAEARMTTDTFSKAIAVEINADEVPVRIAGISKGTGMINLNMTTMLAYMTRDVDISNAL